MISTVHQVADAPHAGPDELEAGLAWVREAPVDDGRLELIVRRPAVDQREILDEGTLDCVEGLAGDTWRHRPSSSTPDGSPHPDRQLTLMNSRLAALVARRHDRWQLAGDQLYVDLDLSIDNAPPGTCLAIGTAVIELTESPHLGCAKFVERFGKQAMLFVNAPVGRRLRLRGANARVVSSGAIRVGDTVRKVTAVRPDLG